MKYYVIGYVDATMSGFVDANSPEEAIDEAGFSPSLCHQCSNEIECCDVYDWQVLDESQENVLIDSDASNQLRAMRLRAEAAEKKLAALVEAIDELRGADKEQAEAHERLDDDLFVSNDTLERAEKRRRAAGKAHDAALRAARGEP